MGSQDVSNARRGRVGARAGEKASSQDAYDDDAHALLGGAVEHLAKVPVHVRGRPHRRWG